MKTTILPSLVLVAIACPAFALLDNTADALGVYFDEGVFDQNSIYPEVSQPFHVYFVLGNCSWDLIAGFEFSWNYDPMPAQEPIISSFLLPPNALNLGTHHNLLVGLGTPYPTGVATVLVDATIVLISAMPCTYIRLGPAVPSCVPGHMCLANGYDLGIVTLMTFPAYEGLTVDSGGWSVPGVATIGCPGPVATEARSWGTIKALFE